MNLSTDHLARCVLTLEAALDLLGRSKPDSLEYEVYRNAVIKGFELSLETSGKLLRRALKEFSSSAREVDELSYKDVFREALKRGLVKDEEEVRRWFSYRDNRNTTAHDYGAAFAESTLVLLPSFISDVRELEAGLRKRSADA
jgi:nucleotidyltransferase substrate binding protein (TIGR01987 family)